MALVVTSLFGVLWCAQGMAIGAGHVGRDTPVGASGPVAQADAIVHGHAAGAGTLAGADGTAVAPPAGLIADAHDHPGTACVATVDLRARIINAAVTAHRHAPTPTGHLIGCARTPDPPIPRSA